MKKILLAGGGVIAWALPMAANAQAADQGVIERGAYLARVGDCVACHTAPDGKEYTGGLAIESPFGTIYSSNITPDKQTGIGDYSEEQFARAVRDGVRADGAHLYPAMPYPSYAKTTDADIHALYVYFMHGVEPVNHRPEQTDLNFPFNQRWAIAMWNWLFTEDEVFQPDPNRSDQLNRGAYLVEGLGHCGSCHTPRGFAQQLKGFDASDEDYLAGADLNDWLAPALRGKGESGRGVVDWSEQDIVDLLATGRNAYTAVSGEMTSVVANSTSHLNDQDIHAIAAYLKSIPAHTGQAGGSASKAASPDKSDIAESGTEAKLASARDLSEGERLYLDNCNACHFTDGKGAGHIFPMLDGNSLVNADNPTGLIHTILAGAEMPSTPKAPESVSMPGFAWRLSDQEVADIATFVRGAWSNDAAAVTADQVAEVRKTLPEHSFSVSPGYRSTGRDQQPTSGEQLKGGAPVEDDQ